MRFSIVAALTAALATSVTAQLEAIPACAYACLVQGIGQTGCGYINGVRDFACVCRNQEFINYSTLCVLGACSPEDVQRTKVATEALCAEYGVIIEIPV